MGCIEAQATLAPADSSSSRLAACWQKQPLTDSSPLVMVPVLSNTTVSTWVSCSTNLEFLIKIPRLVAAARAAIMGAELTSMWPQGQLTTNTAIALPICRVSRAVRAATERAKGI